MDRGGRLYNYLFSGLQGLKFTHGRHHNFTTEQLSTHHFLMDPRPSNKREAPEVDMLVSIEFIVSSVVFLGGIIGYIVSIERRLTRIETKIDSLLGDQNKCPPY